jgi:hypothetical protein
MRTFNSTILLFMSLMAAACGGTGTGNGENPAGTTAGSMTNSAAAVLTTVCTILTQCNPSLSFSQCESGASNVSGVGVKLGVSNANDSTFANIIAAEEAGVITGNTSALQNCEQALDSLACGDAAVTDAYQPGNASPFAQLPNMISSGTNSCAGIF